MTRLTSELQETFPGAAEDLQQRVATAVGGRAEVPAEGVPLVTSCSPIGSELCIIAVRSRWLPNEAFAQRMATKSLEALDTEWVDFCSKIEQAFRQDELITGEWPALWGPPKDRPGQGA